MESTSTADGQGHSASQGSQEHSKKAKKGKRNRNKGATNLQGEHHEAANQQRSAPSPQSADNQTLVPSVQKLFDSVSSPVNLQITVTGDRRQVNETEFLPDEITLPLPSPNEGAGTHRQAHPTGRQAQRDRQQHSSSGKPVKTAASDQQYPPLAESGATNVSAGGPGPQHEQQSRKAQNRKAKRKGKQGLDLEIAKSLTTEDNTAQSPNVTMSAPEAAVDNSSHDATLPSPDVVTVSKHSTAPLSPDVHITDTPSADGKLIDAETDSVAPKSKQAQQTTDKKATVSDGPAGNKLLASREEQPTPARAPHPNEYNKFVDDYRARVGNMYIRELDADFVRPLTRKSVKYPDAHFYCRLCEFHMDTADDMETHRRDDMHMRKKRIKSGDELLRNMPLPTKAHLEALSSYLDSVYPEITLSDDDALARKAVVDGLEKDLHSSSAALQDVRLQVSGSVKAGFALKDSDTNIRIIPSKTSNLAHVMNGVLQALQTLDTTYENVAHAFGSREPHISFTVKGASGTFYLQFSEDGYHIANMLASCYSKWSPKLRQLAVLFKYLAKVAQMSNYLNGGLAPYCYPLMTIFFCQQNDLAPVLFANSSFESMSEAEFQGEIDNQSLPKLLQAFQSNIERRSIGELWLSLLRFYSMTFNKEVHLVCITSRRLVPKSYKAWSTKRLAIEDPAIPRRNLSKTVSHQRVFEFISDQTRKSYKYFAIPQLKSGPAFAKIYIPDPRSGTKKLRSMDIGAPKNAQLNPPSTEAVQTENVLVDKLSSLDISGDVGATPAGDDAVDTTITADESAAVMSNSQSESMEPGDKSEQVFDRSEEGRAVPPLAKLASRSLSATNQEDVLASSSPVKSTGVKDRENAVVDDEEDLIYVKEEVELLTASDMTFDFHSEHLGLATLKLPIFCRQCSKANHLSENCPEEQLPPCVPLPPPSQEHRETLSKLLEDIKEQTQLCVEHKQARADFLGELTERIRYTYPDAGLALYGSSCNGFGSVGSDLDICMTLANSLYIDPADTRFIIRNVAAELSSIEHLYDIIPLQHAKVPIVKFTSKLYGLEADLSLYNILAQRNTAMLYHYSQIDERVRTLGYCVKEFAKNCDMGDASKGSLSSYAYVVMLIYYLQQCDPPILPVLQQLYDGETQPELIVEDWNTWFYEGDNKQLAERWPAFGKNCKDVAQLWLGFLDFYAQKFELQSYVVSIRQLEKMSKFEKLWNSDTLAIEDPFDLKRNLGAALSKKMNAYIRTTFIKARAVFHTSLEPRNELPPDQRPTIYSYFFKHKDLPSGSGERAPDNGRGCRICGKLGHYAKMCPVKSQKKDRQKKLNELRIASRKKAAQENREMERRLSENERNAAHPHPQHKHTPPRGQGHRPPSRHQQTYYGSPSKDQLYGPHNSYHANGHTQHVPYGSPPSKDTSKFYKPSPTRPQRVTPNRQFINSNMPAVGRGDNYNAMLNQNNNSNVQRRMPAPIAVLPATNPHNLMAFPIRGIAMGPPPIAMGPPQMTMGPPVNIPPHAQSIPVPNNRLQPPSGQYPGSPGK